MKDLCAWFFLTSLVKTSSIGQGCFSKIAWLASQDKHQLSAKHKTKKEAMEKEHARPIESAVSSVLEEKTTIEEITKRAQDEIKNLKEQYQDLRKANLDQQENIKKRIQVLDDEFSNAALQLNNAQQHADVNSTIAAAVPEATIVPTRAYRACDDWNNTVQLLRVDVQQHLQAEGAYTTT